MTDGMDAWVQRLAGNGYRVQRACLKPLIFPEIICDRIRRASGAFVVDVRHKLV